MPIRPKFVFPLILLAIGLASAPAVDDSWLHFESGKRLYKENRFGEALNAWKLAVETRRTLFVQARNRLEFALADREAALAKGSIHALIGIFAKRDLIERDLASIRGRAQGSLSREAELLKERRLADGFSGFLDAILLVLEHRPASEIGDSLERLLRASAELASYPEAEYWIGKVYLVEGELRLAELQFKRAFDMRESLDIPEESYAILESLVRIYYAAERWRDYEDALGEIARSAPLFEKKDDFLREAMERSLSRDGFDKFMILYRVEEAASLKANAELGEYFLRNGRPQALIHLAVAANGILTRIINRVKEGEPSYLYVDLPEMLERISRNRELSRYAEESGLLACLYYLGEALAAQGQRDSARGIWRALAGRPGALPWSRLSASALSRDPGIPATLP